MAEPTPPSQRWKAQLRGQIQEQTGRKRQTWPCPKIFGMDENNVWTKGGSIEAKVDWMLLSNWQMQGDWLILRIKGLPLLYYPLSELRERGMYNLVMNRLHHVLPHTQ